MKSEEPKKFDSQQGIRAYLLFSATVLLDLYTEENVIFGRIENGEKVPFERYLSDLGLQNLFPFLHCEETQNRVIDKGIVAYDDIEKLYYEVYGAKVTYIFDGAPISKEFEDDDAISHYKYGLYEYLKGLYATFREIMMTEVEPDLYATVPDILDREEQKAYYFKATRFIKAIKLKKLKQGGCVDRYVKDLPFISPFIMRLLVKRKGRFLLKNNNPESIDYQLALFSCFRFYSASHAKLFELKMLRWEEHKRGLSQVF